jgi:hypothetical protein
MWRSGGRPDTPKYNACKQGIGFAPRAAACPAKSGGEIKARACFPGSGNLPLQ